VAYGDRLRFRSWSNGAKIIDLGEIVNFVLLSSIVLRLAALVWSLLLLRRTGDRRMGFLSAMLALMAMRQLLTLGSAHAHAAVAPELPGLVVSAMALLAVYSLDGLLRRLSQDAERLRSSEAHFRSLVESAIDAVMILDGDGHILYANPPTERLLGFDQEQLRGRIALTLVRPADKAAVGRRYSATLANPGVTHGVDCQMVHADGSQRFVEMRGMAVPRPDEDTRVMVSLRDMTTERLAEQERHSLEKQLFHAQKMETLGTLAGGLAHDFNNILTPIVASGELAQRALPADHPAGRSVQRMIDGAERAKRLVQRLLLVSRKDQERVERIDLRELIADTLELLSVSWPANIEVQRELGTEPCLVDGDTTELQQVVMNLCTNAVQAMGEAGGRLGVRLDGRVPPLQGAGSVARSTVDTWVRLAVSDTGPGIDAERAEHIFEPFFTTKGAGGSGLGLSVVQRIAGAHGGLARLASEEGSGARFEIYLPAAQGSAAQKNSTVTTSEPPAGAASPGRRVLVVDDEEAVLTVCGELLQLEGYEVETTTSARAAKKRFEQQPEAFDCVITDLTMPEMSGVELARQLVLLRPDLPVILTSGFADRDALDTGPGSPLAEVIAKPYTLAELTAALQRHGGDRNRDSGLEGDSMPLAAEKSAESAH